MRVLGISLRSNNVEQGVESGPKVQLRVLAVTFVFSWSLSI